MEEHDALSMLPEAEPEVGHGHSTIFLGKMPQQVEVRAPEDDWTGLTSAAERRKLQNRLHQRTYRKRQKQLKIQGPSHKQIGSSFRSKIDRPTAVHSPINSTQGVIPNPRQFWISAVQQAVLIPSTGATDTQVQSIVNKFKQQTSQEVLTGSPRSDLLLTLIQFNVFRALVQNTFALNFTFSWLTADAISPFIEADIALHEYESPVCLRPSLLQRTVNHHPWIDLFPFPTLRDNLLRRGEEYDDDALCYDLVETCHAPSERSGFIVWGEPWDPKSWEVTEEFARKWPWVLEGCGELFYSTKYWRDIRGEEDLVFDISTSGAVFGEESFHQ